MAAELRIGEIFNRYYSELCQKSKLPDSGESALADWNLSTRIEIVLIKAYLSYLCYCFYSPWQNLWVAGSSCRGSPQRDGQQLRQTLQSLSRRAKRTGVYRWNSDDVKKKKKTKERDYHDILFGLCQVLNCDEQMQPVENSWWDVCSFTWGFLVFVSDDILNEGTQTFCRSWMFERNHCSDGQLHKNHGRRWDVCVCVCVCVSQFISHFPIKLME